MHTCIHACIHTYIHTYVRTCIHTCIHMCILPSPNFAGIDRQTWTMKCIDMCFLATVGSCVVGLLANSGVHTWEICCCQLCARHPWLSFPHSPSKFCQALRLAFHAPLISIGLSIGWVAISFFKNICTWRSKQPRAFPLYFFHDAVCPIAVHQKVRRDCPSEGDSAIAFWQGAVSQLSIQVPDTCLGTCSGFFMETGFSGLD